MPKYKIVCFLLATVIAAVGTVLVIHNLTGTDIPEFEIPVEDLNTYLDRTEDVRIDDENADARTFLFVAHKLLLLGNGFYGVAEGTSTAMGVKQNVRNARYVTGEFGNKNVLKEMVTKGVVSKAYQLFMYENNYVYRQGMKVNSTRDVSWANTARALSKKAFYNDFGHRNDKLTGYILNWDTVTSGQLVEESNGVYTFRYVLDTETAPMYLRREMIFNGGLNGEPTFNKCVIYVAMDADFNVKSLRTDCEYRAQTMGINATCSEDITEIFTPYTGELPEKDFFEQYFTENPDDGIVNEQTALDALMEMFSPYLNGEDLQVAISATDDGDSLVNGLVSIEGLDISDLSKLTVNAKLGDLELAYVHGEGAIYLKYQDFKASTTINGITELVATLTPLLGGGGDGLTFDGIDAESLLDNLTYTVVNNEVIVSLPVTLGELTVDANLYGYVVGDSYSFAGAIIHIGDVTLTLVPNKWTVAVRTGEYPEILGLTDLLQNGKVALNANLKLGEYNVTADVLADIATGNFEVSVELGNNGTVNLACVNGVFYAKFGEVKVKLDTANIDQLLEIVYNYTGIKLVGAPSIKVNAQSVLKLLGSIRATKADKGVDFNLSVLGIDATLSLANNDGRWCLDRITATMGGVNATVVGADALGDVVEPSDAEDYADITRLVETFADPILNILRGDVYGAEFGATLNVYGKQYKVNGSVSVDLRKTLKLDATVYDGSLGIIDAQVIYANEMVYLTLNGVKVAFSTANNSEVDIIAQIGKLLNNEQIQQLINSRQELSQLVEQAKTLVGVVTNFDIDNLLNTDFTAVVDSFSFKEGKLSVSLNGAVLGLDDLALNITLSNDNGRLALAVDGLNVANVGLDVSATLLNTATTIPIPTDTDEYVLNLAGELLGAKVDVTLDFVHMDIWASVQYGSEVILARYLGNNIYVQYGGAKLVFSVSDIGATVGKLTELAGELPDVDFDAFNVLALLSAIKADLTGETPNISLAINDVEVSVNFVTVEGKLVFDSVSVGFTVDGNRQTATVSTQETQAKQVEVSGQFVDGSAAIDGIVDTVKAFRTFDSFAASVSAKVLIKNVEYTAHVSFNLNGGLYFKAKFNANGKTVISAEVYLVDGVLYLDVNGIRQAVTLPDADTNVDVETVLGAIDRLEGINDQLDGIINYVKQLPELVNDVVVSQIISQLNFVDNQLQLELDLTQLGLGKVAVNVSLGSSVTVDVDGRSGNAKYEANATLTESHEKVVAPGADSYVTELQIKAGEHISAVVKLDLFHGAVVGKAVVYGHTVNFRYADGVIYLTYGQGGKVGVKLNLDDVSELAETISKYAELFGISTDLDFDMSLGGDIDIADIISTIQDKLSIVSVGNDNGYSLAINYDGVEVTLDFVTDINGVTLSQAQLNLGQMTVTAKQVYNQSYPAFDTCNFVDVTELASAFIEPITTVVNANGYELSVNGSIGLSGRVYSFDATVKLSNSNVYVDFDLYYQRVFNQRIHMIGGELWIVEDVLYLNAGDLRLALPIEQSASKQNDKSLKDTLDGVKGYNGYVDDVVELILNVLDTPLGEINFEQLISSMTFDSGKLTLGVDGKQFGLSNFTLGLTSYEGLGLTVDGLNYKDITININNANVYAYEGEIEVPNDDYSTNVEVVIDENNTLYANIDLFERIVKMQLVSELADGSSTALGLLYSINDNILKVTNGDELYVSVDITSIDNIVKEIDRAVDEFAGVDAELPMPELGDMSVNLKDVVRSLGISDSGGVVSVSLKALGFNLTANFGNGALSSVTLPVMDDITLTVKPVAGSNVTYYEFSDSDVYVRIDQVFNDYYYGEDGVMSDHNGPIYDLIHTNSWRFDFYQDSIITVTDDDNATTKYQIEAGSFIAFYYKVNDTQNTKLRAKLTINRMLPDSDIWDEFIILDAAYIDGRLYVSYDSNTKDTSTTSWGQTTYSNKNVLRATVSMDALNRTLQLKDELIDVLQLEDLMQQLQDSLTQMDTKLNLGSLATMFKTIGYSDSIFTMALNSGIIEGLGEVDLSVTGEGSTLTLNQLSVNYNNVSVSLQGITVSASGMTNGEFDYVNDSILSYFSAQKKGNASGTAKDGEYLATNDHGYDMSNHMNFDSLYELVSALLRTAGATDTQQRRSFWVYNEQGINVNLSILGLDVINITIPISLYADIDKDGNSYFALKLVRKDETFGLITKRHVYADYGGNSYLLFDSITQRFTIVRDSIYDINVRTYYDEPIWICSKCGNVITDRVNGCQTRGGLFEGYAKHALKYKTEETYTDETKRGYQSALLTPDKLFEEDGIYLRTGLTLEDLVANINSTEGECPLFELFNFGKPLNIDIENMIRKEISKPNTNVYGVEDIFKGYEYSGSSFVITLDLSPISGGLQTFELTIDHDKDYFLNHLSGELKIASVVTISVDLNHETPDFGYAKHFFTVDENHNVTQNYPLLWTEWGGTGIRR